MSDKELYKSKVGEDLLKAIKEVGGLKVDGTTEIMTRQGWYPIDYIRNLEKEIKQKHEEMLYPTVRVRTEKAGGSGSVVYSDKVDDGTYRTYVLTNYHVIDDNVKVEKKWDPKVGMDIKKEVRTPASVEFFYYENYSRCKGVSGSYKGNIKAYNADMDVALLELDKFEEPVKYKAKLIPKEDIDDIKVFDEVYAVGASLGHEPIATKGHITFMDEIIDDYSYWMSTAQTIFGNCLTGDSLVMTNPEGPVPISEITPNTNVFSLGENGIEKHKVLKVIKAGVKQVFELKTTTRKIKASANHPFLVAVKSKDSKTINQFGGKNIYELVWKQLKDIKVGDAIVTLTKLPESKRKLAKEIVRLIGCFIGDGYLRIRDNPPKQSYELCLCLFKQEHINKYSEIIEKLFGKRPVIDNRGIHLYDKEAVMFLDSLGINKKATEKTIPAWIWSLNDDLKKEFIKGVLDSNGYVNEQNAWVFEFNNEELTKQLRMLCISVGYRVSNLHKRMRKSVTINGKHTKPTRESVSFQVYPNTVKKYKRVEGLWGIERLNLFDGIGLERVSKITPIGEEETFDIQVEGAHNFFANGILVHNSGGAVYRKSVKNKRYEFIGIPSRIAVSGLGFSQSPITHMGWFIPITSIYKFIDDNFYEFIYNKDVKFSECEERREQMKKEMRKLIMAKFGEVQGD